MDPGPRPGRRAATPRLDLRNHHLVDTTGHPAGTRVIVRRKLPHPGAQLALFDHIVGWRHQVFITDTPYGHGPIQHLEARHRAHAHVDDRIRCGKTTGFGRFPSREFAINATWLQLALTAIDLPAWTSWLLLDGDLATAEPKKLRYRPLHTAARITRSARRVRLRIAATMPPAQQSPPATLNKIKTRDGPAAERPGLEQRVRPRCTSWFTREPGC